jgi:hypothetical protein
MASPPIGLLPSPPPLSRSLPHLSLSLSLSLLSLWFGRIEKKTGEEGEKNGKIRKNKKK